MYAKFSEKYSNKMEDKVKQFSHSYVVDATRERGHVTTAPPVRPSLWILSQILSNCPLYSAMCGRLNVIFVNGINNVAEEECYVWRLDNCGWCRHWLISAGVVWVEGLIPGRILVTETIHTGCLLILCMVEIPRKVKIQLAVIVGTYGPYCSGVFHQVQVWILPKLTNYSKPTKSKGASWLWACSLLLLLRYKASQARAS